MKPRRLVAAVAAVTGASVIVVSATESASIPRASLSGGPEDVRLELTTLFDELSSSIAGMRTDPYLSAALDIAGTDPEGSIEAATDLVQELSDEDLAVLEQALDSAPSLDDLPAAIDDAVDAASGIFDEPTADLLRPNGLMARSGAGSISGWASTPASSPSPEAGSPLPVMAVSFGATYTDDCATAGDPAALVVATLVLNQLQSAAYAVVIAVPGVFAAFTGIDIPNPAKIVVAVIYGVALAVYLALAQTLDVAVDCAETQLGSELALALPVAGPNSSPPDPAPGTVVRGSSQITVDETLDAVGDVGAQVTAIATNVGLVTGQVELLDAAVAALNTTLSCTTGSPATAPTVACTTAATDPVPGGDAVARVIDAEADLQTLQGNVAILRNTQSGVLVKANDEIDALAAFEALQIRMEIEANLSSPGLHAVGLFQLPAPWGYLDTVAEIVTQMVAEYGAGGGELAEANAAFTAGRYKQAYKLYQQAYQRATK